MISKLQKLSLITLFESMNAEERDEGTISVSYIGLSVAPTMAK